MAGSLAQIDTFRLLEVDGHGIVRRLSHQSPQCSLQLGQHYAHQVESFWDLNGLERFQRHRHAVRYGHHAVIIDRHILIDPQDGNLVVHQGVMHGAQGGGLTQLCKHLPIGPPSLQHALGMEINETIMTLGQESPACIVDQRGMVLWWPRVLETMTGYRKDQVLRQRPPVSFPDDRPVYPFTRDELPYDGVAVQCGRLGAATLTASWIGPRTQQWTLERRGVHVAVGCDRRRPLTRTMGRVINFPLVAKKWLTMSPLAADLLMELFTTFTV